MPGLFFSFHFISDYCFYELWWYISMQLFFLWVLKCHNHSAWRFSVLWPNFGNFCPLFLLMKNHKVLLHSNIVFAEVKNQMIYNRRNDMDGKIKNEHLLKINRISRLNAWKGICEELADKRQVDAVADCNMADAAVRSFHLKAQEEMFVWWQESSEQNAVVLWELKHYFVSIRGVNASVLIGRSPHLQWWMAGNDSIKCVWHHGMSILVDAQISRTSLCNRYL